MHSGLDSASSIRSPVMKSATAIGAAAAANTGVADQLALKAADRLTQETHNLDLFWFIMSLPWGQIASMVAAFYTLVLLAEWFWKKPLRWLLSKIGVKTPMPLYSESEWIELRKK